jgi:hypothetical protein
MADRTTAELGYLPIECNAKVETKEPYKAEIRFPKNGFLRPEKNDFHSYRDILVYIAQIYPSMANEDGTITGSIKRIGKYKRLNKSDEPIFTFGDPILDLITDENGLIKIAGKRIDMRMAELSGQRGGGISTIDLSLHANNILDYQIIEAAQNLNGMTIIECNQEQTIIATI